MRSAICRACIEPFIYMQAWCMCQNSAVGPPVLRLTACFARQRDALNSVEGRCATGLEECTDYGVIPPLLGLVCFIVEQLTQGVLIIGVRRIGISVCNTPYICIYPYLRVLENVVIVHSLLSGFCCFTNKAASFSTRWELEKQLDRSSLKTTRMEWSSRTADKSLLPTAGV